VIFLKKILAVILVFIFSFVVCFSLNNNLQNYTQTNLTKYTPKYNVVIDAGHGGADAGTIGFDSTQEKGINLSIALYLYDVLSFCGIKCFLTRDGDYLVYEENDDTSRSDLYNRMDYINSIDNSLLISIHQNHFEDEKEWGMQIWYSANTKESKTLADNILLSSQELLDNTNNRTNKQSDNSYYLLFKAKVPSIMIECGFMSNEEENKKLQDNNYQQNLAFAIMLGYNNFLNGE
jgi:N-acetylmuramoyl-L-alanine amidase